LSILRGNIEQHFERFEFVGEFKIAAELIFAPYVRYLIDKCPVHLLVPFYTYLPNDVHFIQLTENVDTYGCVERRKSRISIWRIVTRLTGLRVMDIRNDLYERYLACKGRGPVSDNIYVNTLLKQNEKSEENHWSGSSYTHNRCFASIRR